MNTRTLTYAPLLLLFFAVPPARVATDSRRYFTIAGSFLGFCILSFLLIYIVYLRSWGPAVAETHIEADIGEQIRFLIENPTRFVAAVYETLRDRGDWIFKEAIGAFGWDDTPLGFVPYYVFVAIGGAVLYLAVERGSLRLAPPQIAAILGAIALTVVSVFLSLYAAWTPVGADEVQGVQGRYLIGLVPIAIFGLGQLAALIGKRRFVDLLLVFLVPVVIYNLYPAIDLRYYG